MAINTGLAQLSEGLWTAATGTYMLAVVGYTGEYAFGRKGKVNSIAERHSTSPAAVRELVGAGVPAGSSAAGSSAVGSSAVGSTGTSDAGTTPPAKPGWNVGAGVVQTRTPRSQWWGRVAVALTILGAGFHLASVAIRGIAVDRVPWGNMYEFTLVVGLIATVAWLATLVKLPQLRYLGLFVMLPVLVVMFLAGTLYTKASKLVPALQSYWLAIHVSSIATATGILMTSSVLTVLFLVRSRYEKLGSASSQRLAQLGSRLPAAATLDKAAYRAAAFAFPIYTAGVIFGAIWAEAAWGRYWGWDPKETWAFIAWVLYATYLHARATAGWKGNRAAFINLLGFGAMIFNFFVVNLVISGLHSYAGLS